MSTHARIVIRFEDNSVKHIYNHFDGYLQGVGQRLLEYYNSKELVNELISLGDMSSLGNNVEQSVFFARDRNEDLNIETDNSYLNEYNVYVFSVEENKWFYRAETIDNFQPLESGIEFEK